MDKKIATFLSAQTVASVCLLDDNNLPYCFSCFYAFDADEQLLYFKTNLNTMHGTIMQPGSRVAGTIQQDKLNRLAIQGIQFTGAVMPSEISSHYYKRFPFAVAMPGSIWCIQLEWVKFTDNTLAFGKKMIWQKEAEATTLQ